MTIFSGQPLEYVSAMYKRTNAPYIIFEKVNLVRTYAENEKLKFYFPMAGLMRAVTTDRKLARKYVEKLNEQFFHISTFALCSSETDLTHTELEPRSSSEIVQIPRLQKTLVKRDTVEIVISDFVKGIDTAIKNYNENIYYLCRFDPKTKPSPVQVLAKSTSGTCLVEFLSTLKKDKLYEYIIVDNRLEKRVYECVNFEGISRAFKLNDNTDQDSIDNLIGKILKDVSQ